MPPAIDAARVKAKPGALAFNTVSHRLAVLGQWHRLHGWDNPAEAPVLKTLLREARKAQTRQGLLVRKKTDVVLEPLQALLATCSDGVRGVRGRALLLLACRSAMCGGWTPTPGSTPWARPRPTPVESAHSPREAAARTSGARPRCLAGRGAGRIRPARLYKGGKVGTAALSAD